MKKNNFLLFGSLLLLIVSIIVFQLYGKESRTLNQTINIGIIIELCLGLSICTLIQQVMHRRPQFKLPILINKLGTKLANFSYTLYLTHLPIVYLLIHFGFPKSESVNILSIAYYICAIIICLLSAYIIYFFFEKRNKYVKDILKKRYLRKNV